MSSLLAPTSSRYEVALRSQPIKATGILPLLHNQTSLVKQPKSLLSLESIKTYNHQIKRFNKWYQNEGSQSLTMQTINTYLQKNLDEHGSRTTNLVKNALRRVFYLRAASDTDKIRILEGLKMIKIPTPLPSVKRKVLNQEELKVLFHLATPKLSILYRLLYMTGLRLGEVITRSPLPYEDHRWECRPLHHR